MITILFTLDLYLLNVQMVCNEPDSEENQVVLLENCVELDSNLV